jgi:transposase
VHKQTVVAGVRHLAGGAVTRAVRTFKTTTQKLLALSAWLGDQNCTPIAMGRRPASTGGRYGTS